MAETLIEWSDRVWNFLRGCMMLSPGCQFCYAMKQAHRFSGPGGAYEGLTELGPDGPRWNGVVRVIEEKIREPLSVKKGQRWFVNSMSDLFHEDVPNYVIDRAFAVMAWAPHHTYQILTKRSDRMRRYSQGLADLSPIDRSIRMIDSQYAGHPADKLIQATMDRQNVGEFPWPLPNVWLGASVENQKYANLRIPALLQTPAAVRFVSYEPAIGGIDLTNIEVMGHSVDALRGEWCSNDTGCLVSDKTDGALSWVIVGGESGNQARPFNVEWARKVVEQCRTAGVAVFVKQMGAKAFSAHDRLIGRDFPGWHDTSGLGLPLGDYRILQDPKGGDMKEWPIDLRIQEFPRQPEELPEPGAAVARTV